MFLSDYFGFPLPLSFHQCSVLIYTLVLPEAQRGETRNFPTSSALSEIGEHWIEEYVKISLKRTVLWITWLVTDYHG